MLSILYISRSNFVSAEFFVAGTVHATMTAGSQDLRSCEPKGVKRVLECTMYIVHKYLQGGFPTGRANQGRVLNFNKRFDRCITITVEHGID